MPERDYKLILVDGTEIDFAAGSVPLELIGVYTSLAEVDTVRAKLTEENLKGAIFNGEVLENIVPVRLSIKEIKAGDTVYEAHFVNATKSALDIMQEQITELQEALAEIAG